MANTHSRKFLRPCPSPGPLPGGERVGFFPSPPRGEGRVRGPRHSAGTFSDAYKTVSGKRFCRALERQGWKRIKTKSGHRKYEAPDGSRTVVVPFQGNADLKRGLLEALL